MTVKKETEIFLYIFPLQDKLLVDSNKRLVSTVNVGWYLQMHS